MRSLLAFWMGGAGPGPEVTPPEIPFISVLNATIEWHVPHRVADHVVQRREVEWRMKKREVEAK